MKIASFDIGIRNMAYCIFATNNQDISSPIQIIDWNLMDLTKPSSGDSPNVNVPKCTCLLKAGKSSKSKKAKNPPVSEYCKNTAIYSKHDQYYCKKHALSNNEYLIPQKYMTSLKKCRVDKITDIAKTHSISLEEHDRRLNKSEMILKLTQYFESRCYVPIQKQQKVAAKEIDLITIGKRLKEILDHNTEMLNVTHVIIENQISTLATRMKTIQGMLAQYFIMINPQIHVEFVSSSNKLKQFIQPPPLTISESSNNTTVTTASDRQKYNQHKKDAIHYCSQILQQNSGMDTHRKWTEHFIKGKKDDLADCFLQGIWYLQIQNIIIIAEYLKINSI